ncbi:MAG: AzlD domain-containing protein [Pseudomonadales bacterium]
MNDSVYLIAVILVMATVTFITRVIPFVAFENKKDHPLLLHLGRYMPPSIMTLLVLYCLKSVDLSTSPYGFNELSGLLITTALHLWRGNPLLSIFAGTIYYMMALQLGWFS